jgi:hypothetical protein
VSYKKVYTLILSKRSNIYSYFFSHLTIFIFILSSLGYNVQLPEGKSVGATPLFFCQRTSFGERNLQILTVFFPFDHDSNNHLKQFWSRIGNELKLELSIEQMRNCLISASKSCRVQQYIDDDSNHYGGLGIRPFQDFLANENAHSLDKFQKFISAGVVQVNRIDQFRAANHEPLLSDGHGGATPAIRQRNCVIRFLETSGIPSLRNEILQNGQINIAELNRGAFRRMESFVLPQLVRPQSSILTDFQAMYRGWAVTFFPEQPDAGDAAVGDAGAGAAAVGAAGAEAGAARINAIPREAAFYELDDVAGQPWLMATDNRINVAAPQMDE